MCMPYAIAMPLQARSKSRGFRNCAVRSIEDTALLRSARRAGRVSFWHRRKYKIGDSPVLSTHEFGRRRLNGFVTLQDVCCLAALRVCRGHVSERPGLVAVVVVVQVQVQVQVLVVVVVVVVVVAVCCLLFVVCCLLFIVVCCWFLVVVCCWLFVVCCLLLMFVCCVLCVVCCLLLFVVAVVVWWWCGGG